MESSASGSSVIGDTDPVAVRVDALLDKRTNGELIFLDWNAFEPSSVLKNPELKDIHQRLCPQLEYAAIREDLRDTVARKRASMMAMAKEMIFEKILTECQALQVKTNTGTLVTSKGLLNIYMKESNDEETISQFTVTCFKTSPRWKEDMTQSLIEFFGIHYDESTMVVNTNRKGNGFLEKIVTKALNNVRLDLRAVQSRATGKVSANKPNVKDRNKRDETASRKRSSSSTDDDDMKYKRVSFSGSVVHMR
jgi:hypothetical protein